MDFEAAQDFGLTLGNRLWNDMQAGLLPHDGTQYLAVVALAMLATLETMVLSWVTCELEPEARLELLEHHFTGVERGVIRLNGALDRQAQEEADG